MQGLVLKALCVPYAAVMVLDITDLDTACGSACSGMLLTTKALQYPDHQPGLPRSGAGPPNTTGQIAHKCSVAAAKTTGPQPAEQDQASQQPPWQVQQEVTEAGEPEQGSSSSFALYVWV